MFVGKLVYSIVYMHYKKELAPLHTHHVLQHVDDQTFRNSSMMQKWKIKCSCTSSYIGNPTGNGLG